MSLTMRDTEGDCSIDVYENWAESLNQKLEAVLNNKRPLTETPTIFKVPAVIREANPGAYTPRVISIGPYHSHDPHLQPMDRLKYRYLKKTLAAHDAKLEDYLKTIQDVETVARSSYSESTDDITSMEFVEMLLLDGCFILQLLLSGDHEDYDDEIGDAEDPIRSTKWALSQVYQDLLMLENQIPFFILERLFGLMVTAADFPNQIVSKNFLIQRLIQFFGHLISRDEFVPPWKASVLPKFHHILHFVHSLVLPAHGTNHKVPESKSRSILSTISCHRILSALGMRPSSSLPPPISMACSRRHSRLTPLIAERSGSNLELPITPESVPCATKLNESGVKIKMKPVANSFLDVTFKDGALEIPLLPVYEDASILFLNLIAFEQCFPKAGTHVVAYATLMDCLIDTADDVALLQRRGCIVNGLGSDDEVAAMFNLLGKGVTVDCASSYLAPLFRSVTDHCGWRWNRWRAKLMHDYFSNPWSFLSLVGALVVILLTAVQTAFALLAYFLPPT